MPAGSSVPAAALLVLTGLLVATAPAASSGPDRAPTLVAAAAVDCDDALLVAVPGGGEGGPDDPGSTLGALTAPLLSEAQSGSRTLATRVVHAETLGPSALQGRGTRRTSAHKAVTRAAWSSWRAPVPGLVAGVEEALAETLSSCPDQLVYLVGYSQGAEAVHRYLTTADADLRSRTVAVVLVGDPARVSGSAGPLSGDPHASRRAEGVSARFARKPLPAVPADGWRGPVHSVCTVGDLACDLGDDRFRGAQRVHASYDTTADSLLGSLGRQYGERIALWPRPQVGQEVAARVALLVSQRIKASVAPQAPHRAAVQGHLAAPTRPDADQARHPDRFAHPRRYLRARLHGPQPHQPRGLAADGGPGERGDQARRQDRGELRRPPHLPDPWRRHAVVLGRQLLRAAGTGDTTSGPTPRQVGSQDDWVDVSAGGMHTCGVRENGSAWCWGLNYRGQLGTGNRKDQVEPRRVGDGRDWETVSAGWVHTCAKTLDGTASCWGDNAYGQLGNGNLTDSYDPARVTRGLSFREVSRRRLAHLWRHARRRGVLLGSQHQGSAR